MVKKITSPVFRKHVLLEPVLSDIDCVQDLSVCCPCFIFVNSACLQITAFVDQLLAVYIFNWQDCFLLFFSTNMCGSMCQTLQVVTFNSYRCVAAQ